ncbi:MAG: metallophosphoesterase family protein [Acidobacteriota bacterium]
MRYFIFTDIHGNMEAMDAILAFASKQKIDHFIFLGDMVGYGASPNEIIDRIRSLQPLSLIRGNHDKAVCELDTIKSFNPIAASAILWTREAIDKKNRDYLLSLKKGPLVIDEFTTICHGAPFDEDFYIFGEFDAAEAFLHFETSLCFFGHTHFPFIYTERDHIVEGDFIAGNSFEITLEKNMRYLINPGSVGQPRDRNTRAACAVYDADKHHIAFHRLEYDIEAAQKKILAADLPPALAERLSLGI